jgi:hypothetical protein
MKLSSAVILLALFLPSVSALADNNSFDLQSIKGDKKGVSTYSYEKSKTGYKIKTSTGSGADGSQNRCTIEYKISSDGLLSTALFRALVTQAVTYYSPSKVHDKLSVSILVANNPVDSFDLSIPEPKYLMAFSNDPAIWQVLVDLAINQPRPDHLYTIFTAPTSRSNAGQFQPILLATPTPAKGTLNGQPIELKNFNLTLKKGNASIYTDQTGNMMQADINYMGIRYVRTGFVLGK